MHYKVVKGTSVATAAFDSSFPDKKRADARAKQLRNGLRGPGKRIEVWVLPLVEGDPINQKPVKHKDSEQGWG